MRIVAVALFLGVHLGVAGCRSETRAHPVRIDMKDVPAAIMKVAAEHLPGVKFDSALKQPNGSYEIRGRSKTGKLHEIDIRPDGTVEEIE